MENKDDWRQTVISQHQMLAAIAGFSITGLIIFASFGKINFLAQKIIFSASLALLICQVALLLIISEIERKATYQANIRLNESENVLRPILNVVSFLSWLSISILLIITIW